MSLTSNPTGAGYDMRPPATQIPGKANYGRATFSGSGATVFTFAHGLGAAPASVLVTPGHADVNGAFHVTADATNISVTFAAAPIAGVNNVVLNWAAYS
jgi:hypothetical protein